MNNRDIDIAQRYHEATKLLYIDLPRKPPAYKQYRALLPLPLPTEVASLDMPALQAVAATSPRRSPTPSLDLTMLATLLFFAAGRIRRRAFVGAGEVIFRAAASAGGLYPVEIYAVCGDMPGLAAGVYHFSPADFALRRLRQGDYRMTLAQAAGDSLTVASAPATLVCSAVFWRSAWKYRVRSYRYCFWDTGTILANLLAAAAALGVPARILLGFVDAHVHHLLGLDGRREASTCLVPVGSTADGHVLTQVEPAPPSSVESVEEVPASREEIDYPEITHLHTAASLTTPDEVLAWRGTLALAFGVNPGASYALFPLAPATLPPATLGEVIRQRGSTRRFARQPITLAQLSTILAHATTGVPADFLGVAGPSLLHLYLIANAVTDLPTGRYVLTPPPQSLSLLQAEECREEAGHLCFEQALGADASVVVFFLADLAAISQRFGNRGYRAVQMEAGIMGGKLYLGAGALGLGASGLTFYDDEVTAFFTPHAAGKSAIFVVALGHTASENRVRPFRSRLGMRLDALSRLDF